METMIPVILVFTLVVAVCVHFAGKVFGCNLSFPAACGVAVLGAATYAIPTYGPSVSFLAMVLSTWKFSDGDFLQSLYTAGTARLLVIPALFGLNSLLG